MNLQYHYYQSRLNQELALSENTSIPEIAATHRQLAEFYRGKVEAAYGEVSSSLKSSNLTPLVTSRPD